MKTTTKRESVAVLDWTQRATDFWQSSTDAAQRRILSAVKLNRTLADATLVTPMRKPFDVFAKGLEIKNSRGDSSFTQPKILAFSADDVRQAG